MGIFTHSDTALEWRGGHETVRIQPWGRNSLRVQGTVPHALRQPGRTPKRPAW